jgi:hypothetical protein
VQEQKVLVHRLLVQVAIIALSYITRPSVELVFQETIALLLEVLQLLLELIAEGVGDGGEHQVIEEEDSDEHVDDEEDAFAAFRLI